MNITLDLNLRSARMLQAGRLTVTFLSPSGTHITLLAKCSAPNDKGKWGASNLDDAKVVWVSVPSEGGWDDKVAKITSKGITPDPNADPARVWCVKQLLRFVAGEELAPGLTAMEEERCGKCGKALTDPVSIERGIGPTCLESETGAKHQAKTKAPRKPQEAAVAPASTTPDTQVIPTPQARTEAHSASKVDKQGVPMGYGDWRARAKVRKAVVKDNQTARVYPAYCDQMTVLPGTTWEDIFRGAAEAKGIDLTSPTILLP